MAASAFLHKWHEVVLSQLNSPDGGDEQAMMKGLNELFHDDIVFLAPTYLKERKDKKFSMLALLGVSKAFKNFEYTREMVDDKQLSLALEFTCNIGKPDGLVMRGVDLITLDAATGKAIRFEVMARPPKAVLELLDLQSKFIKSRM
ncbi:unnamed protein product [Effrenium voratum]|nr:unnamed protein product [Effrenium voratum]CAJ1446696.1 unnamed protein product [Effrenium voratum]